LRLNLPAGSSVIGYADDTVVLVGGNSFGEAVIRANVCLVRVIRKIRHLDLEVSPKKTETKVFDGPSRLVGWIWDTLVSISSSIRYLGLILDPGWSFREYFREVFPRVERMVVALRRLMPNLRRMGDGDDCMPKSSTRS